jgi:ribosomal protein L37AE/L43A
VVAKRPTCESGLYSASDTLKLVRSPPSELERCPRCGYQLVTGAAVEVDRCSECGLVAASAAAREARRVGVPRVAMAIAASAVLLHGLFLRAGMEGFGALRLEGWLVVAGRTGAAFTTAVLVWVAASRMPTIRFVAWRRWCGFGSSSLLVVAGGITLAVGLYANGLVSFGSWFDQAVAIDGVQRAIGWASPAAQLLGSVWLLALGWFATRQRIGQPGRGLAFGAIGLGGCGLLLYLLIELALRESWLVPARWLPQVQSLVPARLTLRVALDALVGMTTIAIIVACRDRVGAPAK